MARTRKGGANRRRKGASNRRRKDAQDGPGAATTADGPDVVSPATKKQRNRISSQHEPSHSSDSSAQASGSVSCSRVAMEEEEQKDNCPKNCDLEATPSSPVVESESCPPKPIEPEDPQPEFRSGNAGDLRQPAVPDIVTERCLSRSQANRPKILSGPAPHTTGYLRYFAPFKPTDPDQMARWQDPIIAPGANGLIQDYFEDVHSKIETLVYNGLPTTVSLDDVVEVTRQKLLRLSPHAGLMVQDRANSMSRIFFQAWVWQILCDNLFSPDCSDKWKQGPWGKFISLMRSVQVDVNDTDDEYSFDYFTSKHRLARMLFTKHGAHSDLQRLKDIILNELRPLLAAGNMPETDAHKDVEAVAQAAILLDLQMISSTYQVEVVMKDSETGLLHGFPMNHDKRVVLNRIFHHAMPWEVDVEPTMDLISKPSLRQFGISDPRAMDPYRVSNRWYCSWLTPLEVECSLYPEARYGITRADFFHMNREKMRVFLAKKRQEDSEAQREEEIRSERQEKIEVPKQTEPELEDDKSLS